MPLNGREFSQLAALMPGARITGSYAEPDHLLRSGRDGRGTAASKNSYSVDGATTRSTYGTDPR